MFVWFFDESIEATKAHDSEDVKKKWLLIDAKDAVLGRLAVHSANILRGKNKPNYTPNQDCGDNLIIINADHVHLTGKKSTDKIYYRHTGYPGGIKETNPIKMKAKTGLGKVCGVRSYFTDPSKNHIKA